MHGTPAGMSLSRHWSDDLIDLAHDGRFEGNRSCTQWLTQWQWDGQLLVRAAPALDVFAMGAKKKRKKALTYCYCAAACGVGRFMTSIFVGYCRDIQS